MTQAWAAGYFGTFGGERWDGGLSRWELCGEGAVWKDATAGKAELRAGRKGSVWSAQAAITEHCRLGGSNHRRLFVHLIFLSHK